MGEERLRHSEFRPHGRPPSHGYTQHIAGEAFAISHIEFSSGEAVAHFVPPPTVAEAGAKTALPKPVRDFESLGQFFRALRPLSFVRVRRVDGVLRGGFALRSVRRTSSFGPKPTNLFLATLYAATTNEQHTDCE